MLVLLLAAQFSTHCSPDYIGGFRCTTPPPPVVMQPLPQTPYVSTDWGAIFQRIRDNRRAKEIGRLLAAGDCAGAERYAAQRGELALAVQVRDYCQTASPAVVAPRRPILPLPPVFQEGPRKIHAKTRSGFCIDAPPDYVGTGAQNAPTVTSAMPRCSELHD